MPHRWQALYESALQSEPSLLLERIAVATAAMHARAYTLGFSQLAAEQSERRALFLSLYDLYVLRVAFLAARNGGVQV